MCIKTKQIILVEASGFFISYEFVKAYNLQVLNDKISNFNNHVTFDTILITLNELGWMFDKKISNSEYIFSKLEKITF